MEHYKEIEQSGKMPPAFLESVIMSAPGIILVVEPEQLKIIYSDARLQELLGYDIEEAKSGSLSLLDIIDKEQHSRIRLQVADVMVNAAGRNKYVIYKMHSKAGKALFFSLYASPLRSNNGQYEKYCYLFMIPDATPSGLRFTSFDSRELFFEHFNRDGLGTFEWVKATDKIFLSDGVYKIFDIADSPAKISLETIDEHIFPEDKEYVTTQIKHAFDTGVSTFFEFRVTTAANNIKVLQVLCRAIGNADNNIQKLVGSVKDVTPQRNAELNLQAKVQELNRSNHELEEFAYVASHDLQEPLRKITTFSDRLRERYSQMLEGEGAMYLERMTASAENMRMLINNLLEFSRVTRSTQPFMPVSLNFILQQVRHDIDLVLEETKTVIVSDQLPTVEASLSQIKQLFTNIILNAIKFHKEGVAPEIKIETAELSKTEKRKHNLLADSIYYKIQITDNGIGFEDEYAERIFQIFQRLHGKSEYPGSGIGLAICKKILEHHHGIIYAENVPGQGARFVFIIPEKQINLSA